MRLSQLTDEQLQAEVNHAATTGDQERLNRLADECDRRDRHTPPAPAVAATLHQAARWYATQGIACFPLKPLSKQPATTHGFKDASCDLGQIDQWWTRTPNANIGLPTGIRFDVADLDGWPAVDVWAGLDDAPEVLGIAVTPRAEGGGRHLYLRPTGQGNATGLMPKIDWRGQGGYVVAAPSILPDGRYWWRMPLQVGAL